MSHEKFSGTELHKRLHNALDEIIRKRTIWRALRLAEQTPDASGEPVGDGKPGTFELAKQIWDETLILAAELSAGARSQLAPIFDPKDRISMRHSFSELLHHFSPIIPMRPSGLSPVSERCHSLEDIITYIDMLDYGQTPALFEREKTNRSVVAWEEDRYKFLQALWAVHVDERGDRKPDAVVASYFSSSATAVRTLSTWRTQLVKAADCGEGIWSLSATQIREAVAMAKWAALDGRSGSDTLIAAMFWGLAFGRRFGFVGSIEEAGEKYRCFRAKVDASQRKSRKRGARAKKPAKAKDKI